MELKKSPKADLESKRKVFLEVGLVLALAACLFSFETSKKVGQTMSLGVLENQSVVEDIPPLVRPEEKKPEMPPPPKVVDLIKIVDNDMKLSAELDIINSEPVPGMAINPIVQAFDTKEKDVDEDKIFVFPSEMPEFPGGPMALLKYLNQNVKYPVIAAENGVNGKVTVSFVVNKDGSICDVKILRGVDPALDQEAIRVVSNMPRWKPGKQGDKPVRVSYRVPINFRLSQ